MLQFPRKIKNSMSDYNYKYITGTQGAFPDKVAPDIDGFTDEIMRCSSCKKSFRTWLQINNKMITKFKCQMYPNKFWRETCLMYCS